MSWLALKQTAPLLLLLPAVLWVPRMPQVDLPPSALAPVIATHALPLLA